MLMTEVTGAAAVVVAVAAGAVVTAAAGVRLTCKRVLVAAEAWPAVKGRTAAVRARAAMRRVLVFMPPVSARRVPEHDPAKCWSYEQCGKVPRFGVGRRT